MNASEDELIARCYEAGSGKVPWEALLGDLVKRLDLAVAVIFGVDPRHQRLLYTFESGPAAHSAALIDYARNFHRVDPYAQYGLGAPVGQFVSFAEIWSDEEIEHLPYQRDFNVPYGIRHMHGVKLHHDEGCAVMLGVHRGPGGSPLTGDDRALAERIGFHLCRAMAIYVRQQTTLAEAAVGRVLLDRLDAAVLLVDAERRVRVMNRAAEALFSAQPAIGQDGQGRLCCTQAAIDDELVLALKALQLGAAAGGNAAGRAERRVIAVPLPSAVRPLVLCLLALRPETTLAAFGPRALAMVVIYDANRTSPLDPFAVAAAFDLTPAEARVAVRLASGLSREQVAAEHGVSIHTVNSHVRAVHGKLGVTRTSEMIAMLRSVPLGV